LACVACVMWVVSGLGRTTMMTGTGATTTYAKGSHGRRTAMDYSSWSTSTSEKSSSNGGGMEMKANVVGRVSSEESLFDDARRKFTFKSRGRGHALVTGGAGYIGSHCALKLLELGYAVTVIDNLSRGNSGAVRAVRRFAPEGMFRAVFGDLGRVEDIEAAIGNANEEVDVVFHFAAIAYVGESMADPLKYYRNVTTNTVNLLDVMAARGVTNLVYSSTCATYGNAKELPITEKTPTVPINPYGKSKLYAENAIRDYAKANPDFKATILRYFNVFGSDPEMRVGELPRAELRAHGRISGACFDAAMKNIDKLTVMGTKHPTRDGTTIRDFVHVVDLVDAHIAIAQKQKLANPPSLYNVGTGKGVSMLEFVEACKKVTAKDIEIEYREEPRPGDYAEVYANVDKIRNELGWEAKYTNLEESLSHAWKFRSNIVDNRWD
jgi:UDP-arabinose 4-epimerase